ncbi:gliding motility-associated C-terminal domain-containing protein [Cesiribacter sp. SM1]|uniref:lectin-like domain-containing protein n=1 Tax=Cesiribacter sp. SM1 TaxID=2861196 RepID=UPI001CD47C97|nr:gliding motility-associated C-terminal domain-containing protein [Cesiribacter sp. SM1]
MSLRQIRSGLILLLLLLPGISFCQFIPKGDAVKVSDRCFKVTEDELGRFGAVWWDKKVDLTKPLELNFVLFLGSRDTDGADGIAFVLHNDARGFNAKGTPGGGLGFAYHPTHTTDQAAIDVIKPSVAIEFDTYFNRELVNELRDDHTVLVYNGDLNTAVIPAVRIDPDHPDIEDNQCHDYTIKWNPATQELQMYFDGKLRFSHTDDIINNIFGGNSLVYYGFTGSTGTRKNEQTICVNDADSKPEAMDDGATTEPLTSVHISALANDSHTTGDAIGISAVVVPPKNGEVVISGDQLIYTPHAGFVGTDTFTYEVCEVISDKCYAKCASALVKIEVVCKSLPAVPVVNDMARCGSGKVTLVVEEGGEGAGSYRWYASASDALPLAEAEDGHFTTPALSQTTTFYVAYFDGNCESERRPVKAIINKLPDIYAGEDVKVSQGESVQLFASGEGAYEWFPSDGLSDPTIANPIARPAKTTTYTLTVIDEQGCSATDEVTITVVDGIFVPNAFTPNGDGLNDEWEILMISDYPNCRIEVYDRWGNLVFTSSGYTRAWNGAYKGKKLPLGSYAYIIHLGEGEKSVTGSVSIMH